jgi:hypothetical protein
MGLILLIAIWVVFIASFVVPPMLANGTLPFYLSGAVGFVLLGISVWKKHAIIGALGAGLVAAAFSHWVGPISFPGK